MKKVALLGLFLSLFLVTPSIAAYTFTADATDNTISATLSGVAGSTSSFKIFVLTKPFPAGDYVARSGGFEDMVLFSDEQSVQKPSRPFDLNNSNNNPLNTLTEDTVRWALGGLSSNTTYYVRVVENPKVIPPAKAGLPLYVTESKTVTTREISITPSTLDFIYDENVKTVLVTGHINLVKNPNFERYAITIQYSKNPLISFTADSPAKFPVYQGHVSGVYKEGVDKDGKYHLSIPGLDPSTPYNIRETITAGKSSKVTDGTFKSGTGYILSGSQTNQDDFESRSYRLLAPFPGLTVLLDPDLCAEKVLEGAKGQVCDINDFLNLAFKILIGLAAVLLVLRIMYEGYKYMLTDIPYIKADAKSGFWEALMGLVLALSSFLILNTINPKLVENTINTDRLEIGVEIVGDGTSPFTIGTKAGGLSKNIYCPGTGGVSEVAKIATSFSGNVVYSQTLRNRVRPDGKQSLDCSSYVAQVLSCAGYNIPSITDGNNVNTEILKNKGELIRGVITKNGNELVVNGKQLYVGDLLGWRKGSVGHVVMYLGNGKIIDVHGPVGSEKNAQEWSSIDYYQNKYGFQFVYRVK